MSATPSARFPATAWSCIEASRDSQHPKYVNAVNRLIGHWKDEWNSDPTKIRTDIYYLLDADGDPGASFPSSGAGEP